MTLEGLAALDSLEAEALFMNDITNSIDFVIKGFRDIEMINGGYYGVCAKLVLDIMDKKDESTLFIDTWLMSCRVLKRGMEEFIVNAIVDTARKNGFARVIGEYIPTPKNAMVSDVYSRLGFKAEGDGRFVCDTASFVPNKTYIES